MSTTKDGLKALMIYLRNAKGFEDCYDMFVETCIDKAIQVPNVKIPSFIKG